ncbi:AcrR family [Fructobacillus cardui]|uniref:TetR/AcrR family transcriptional regulator n=1 Tax=Fructobacillus cardui TaxID=2893170 RepID=UPI002DA6F952|nr:AcrR family [Fructobacillus cardui]CAK1253780.1 AcrR family [Fructobacillus cardui]
MDTTLYLMQRIPFSKLSVTQICKSAEIGRIAFYKQFDSKYEVLHYILARVIDKNLTILNMQRFRDSPFETFFSTEFPERVITFQYADNDFRKTLNDDLYEIIYDLTNDDSLVWFIFEMLSIAEWYTIKYGTSVKKDVKLLDSIIKNKSFRPCFIKDGN